MLSRIRNGVGARSDIGRKAEEAVRVYLCEAGWSIVAMNLRVGLLEIDLVARRDATVAVVEVRTRGRGAWTSAFGSIGRSKRARIRAAGQRLWQRRYRNDPTVDRIRFDAASVSFHDNGEATVEYVAAAF